MWFHRFWSPHLLFSAGPLCTAHHLPGLTVPRAGCSQPWRRRNGRVRGWGSLGFSGDHWDWISQKHQFWVARVLWCFWVNYHNSLTWIKAMWGWFPLLTMISSEGEQWGRYNLPRCFMFYVLCFYGKRDVCHREIAGKAACPLLLRLCTGAQSAPSSHSSSE